MMRDRISFPFCSGRGDSYRAPRRFGARCIKGPHHRHENFIVRGFGYREMKRAIPLRPAVIIRDFDGASETIFDGPEIGLRSLRRGKRRNSWFHSKSRLHDVCGASGSETTIDAGSDRRRCASQDRAIATTAPYLAFQFHLSKTLSNHPPANSKCGCQLSLWRKTIAFFQSVLFDICFNFIHDLKSLSSLPDLPRTVLTAIDGQVPSEGNYEFRSHPGHCLLSPEKHEQR